MLYSTIGVIAAVLMVRHARRGLVDEPDQPTPSPDPATTGPSVPSLTY